MIDLSRTRGDLLANLDALDLAAAPLVNLTDARVMSTDAHARISGHTRSSLFPLLETMLSERYAALPRSQVIRDLLLPLRNALGNAFAHGNHHDPAKAVGVELMLTCSGVLIAVTDEGNGFDVGLTFRRFRDQVCYFESRGVGFRNLHRASSAVTYEDGGRTVLLCFQPVWQEAEAVLASYPNALGNPTLIPAAIPVLNKVTDSRWIQTRFSSELPEFAEGQQRIESCHAYTVRVLARADCTIRYVLEVHSDHDRSTATHILTGRLHTDEATASVAFESATRLYNANAGKKGLRIPRPVAQLKSEPRLVLYDFHPWMDLWEYLSFHDLVPSLQHSANRIGQWLGALHRSQKSLPVTESNVVKSHTFKLAGAEQKLAELPGGSVLVRRFRSAVQRIQDRGETRGPKTVTPIHGSLGWDCIHYGVDKRFYLSRFETCSQGDPRIDLGGYAADLLAFTRAQHEEAAYPGCCDELLRSHHSMAGYSMHLQDLQTGIVLAVSERLQRASSLTKAGANLWLGVLEALGSAPSTRDSITYGP